MGETGGMAGVTSRGGALVLAVIHHESFDLSVQQAQVARKAGCAGIVLIQMEGRDHEIDGAAGFVKECCPGFLVGANRLSAEPWEAVARDHALGLDLSWSDDPGVTSRGDGPRTGRIDAALAAVRARNPDFLFFGSVAFKTQLPDPDPAGAARAAAAHPWIVTTSGKATGNAPDESKLAAMAGAVGRGRLAVASGITPDNAPALARHVRWVLASTGISRSFVEFDPERVRALVKACAAA